jgi:hypothetical protein
MWRGMPRTITITAVICTTLACGGVERFEGGLTDTDAAGDVAADTAVSPDAVPDASPDVPIEPIDVVADAPPDTAWDPVADTIADVTPEPVVPPYGLVDMRFSSAYLLDGTRVEDSEYVMEHPDGIVMGGAFSGSYGASGVVPPEGGWQTFAIGARVPPAAGEPASVLIVQVSQSMSGMLDPSVQLVFPTDALVETSYDVDVAGEDDVLLLLVNGMETGDDCVLALGIGGSVTVTHAVDTTLVEGGELDAEGMDIPLYHPSATPYGDVTAELVSSGTDVCPME